MGTDCSVGASHTLFVTIDIDKQLVKPCHVLPELCSLTDSSIMGKSSLESLWSLERIGIRDPLTVNNDDEIIHKCCESIKFSEGAYYVTWAWKQQQFCLDDNYILAFKQLKSLVSCLGSDPELLQNITAQLVNSYKSVL